MTGDPRAARAAGPAPADAVCGDCGARMPIGAKFCSMCGASYAWRSATPTTSPRLGVGDGFRFGLGFALAGTLVGLVLWLLGIVLLGAFLGAVASSVGEAGKTFSGTGPAITDSFELSGDVDVTWSATPVTPGGCRHAASVQLLDRPNVREVIADQQVGVATTGAHTLRGLASARYVVDVTSDCQWSFRLKER